MTSFASSPPTKFTTFTGNPTANLSCSHFLSLIYASESLGIPLIWLLFEGRKRHIFFSVSQPLAQYMAHCRGLTMNIEEVSERVYPAFIKQQSCDNNKTFGDVKCSCVGLFSFPVWDDLGTGRCGNRKKPPEEFKEAAWYQSWPL